MTEHVSEGVAGVLSCATETRGTERRTQHVPGTSDQTEGRRGNYLRTCQATRSDVISAFGCQNKTLHRKDDANAQRI